MLRLAVRGVAARKLRALTTTLAVFLGVGLVAGTYVLTDTINASFDEIFTESLKGTDVVVTTRQPVTQDTGEIPAFPAKYLKQVRAVKGVAAAAGAIFSPGAFFDSNGDAIGSQFAPKFISSVLPKDFETLTYVDGSAPSDASEASLDQASADKAGISLGDTIKIVSERRAKTYTLTGFTQLGNASFGGAGIAQLILPEAQRITGKEGEVDQISVGAASGVSPAALRNRIAAALPSSVRVETGQQNADRQSQDIRDALGFLQIALLVFAGVSLFVGAFLIFNTFSITVAQRIREFGMLRTLGASRLQILRSVVLEAAIIGALGSLAGLAGGMAFAPAINALFKATGIDLPNTGTVVATRTVIVSLVVGLVVTVVAALIPALRATRVTPMAALREAELPTRRRHGVLHAAIAGVLGVGGIVLLAIGLFGSIDSSSSAAAMTGGGAVAILLAVSLFSARLVKPLASVAGAPLERLRGLTGRLARENAIRKPGRTAVTAAALMIGLALVTFVTVFAAGLSKSTSAAIDRNFQGDLTIQNTDGFSPIPGDVAKSVRRQPGVETVSTMRFSQARVNGAGKERFTGLDPSTANEVLSLDWVDGSPQTLSSLADGNAIVDQAFADSSGIGVGDCVSVLTQTGRHVSLTVTGSVKDNADLLGSFVITQREMARAFGETSDSQDFVKLAPGADAAAVQARLDALVKRDFPSAEVLNQQQLKDKQEEQINQLLGLVYALLSLAVLVSLFGIANTLALSIHERRRELGMLRAIGMSRPQVRRMIRYEAVITAVIGAVLGTFLGVVFAAAISRPLADEGFVLAYPVPSLILLLVLAALAGVLAAIAPARRAARLSILEALAYE